MKKKINLLFIALMAMLALSTASCSKDDDGDIEPNNYDKKYEIYVNGSDKWTPFAGKSGVKFTVSDDKVISISDNGTRVEFTGLLVGESTITASLDGTESKALVKVVKSSDEDGEGTEFTGTYVLNIPTDTYHVRIETNLLGDGGHEEYAKIGNIAAYRSLMSSEDDWEILERGDITTEYEGSVYCWDCDGGKWQQMENGGAGDIPVIYEQTDILTRFYNDIVVFFRGLGFNDQKLDDFYLGTEKFLGIDCWVFDSKGTNGKSVKYWVDPSNGLTLKIVGTIETDKHAEVTVYDLNYTEWDSSFEP